MLNHRSRRLTIALAAGALTMFGAAGAFAAENEEDGERPGDGSGSTSPACILLKSPPACPDPGAPGGGEGGGGGGDAQPANESNPLCGTPLSAMPICAAPGEPPSQGGGGGGGGDTQPSPGAPGGGGDGVSA